MFSRTTSPAESPSLILDRATSLVEYLMAVRAQMEKPARTVPQADAFWQHDSARPPGLSGRRLPGRQQLVAGGLSRLRRRNSGHPPSSARISSGRCRTRPNRAWPGDEETIEHLRTRFEQWRERVWRPWADQARRTEEVRRLHRSCSTSCTARHDRRHHRAGLGPRRPARRTIDGERVRYPLVATPVLIEYEPDRSLITVSPQGPRRLQTDAARPASTSGT